MLRAVPRVSIVHIDPVDPAPEVIRRAADILRGGGLVAFPTETVYGLGGNALDPNAVARIFAAKQRPSYNPLIAHCASLSAARRLASSWPEAAQRLGTAFWPGPLTLVLPKRDLIPESMTAGLSTVAIRVPSHPVAMALLREADLPIAAPSANRFTELSPTRAEHVLKGMQGRVDLILDAGPTPLGIESTVVSLAGEVPLLLRPGTITKVELEEVLGMELALPAGWSAGEARPAPGTLDRHYSPRAALRVIEGGGDELRRQAAEAAGAGARVGALLLAPDSSRSIQISRVLAADPAGYARLLFASLHELDEAGCDVILVESPPAGPEWAGVRDRLSRAARSS
jgi:L-threonylcarbamoyladenylate synthase